MYLGSSKHYVVCPESQSCCLRGGLDDLEDPGKMLLLLLLLLLLLSRFSSVQFCATP